MGKMIIKRLFSVLLSSFGIHSLVERFRLSNKAFILMYHRVLTSAGKQEFFVQPGMFVTTISFEKHIAFLRERFEVVFFEDLVEKFQNGENMGGVCAVTFDDGWRDNYTNAFPILKKYRVPASIFLATGFVGTDRIFWPEEICYYLERNTINKFEFENLSSLLSGFFEEISKYHQGGRERFFDKSVETLKRYSPNERLKILEYFRGMFRAEPFPRQMLSWDEAREMLLSGLVRFGAHTVNHEILDQVSLQTAGDEISKSREEIELRLGSKVRTFAYPNGNYSKAIRMILSESGFNAAVTTQKGFLDRGRPLMEIPRISIHEDVSNTIPMLRSRILFRKF